MALAFTNKTQFSSATDATSYTTASVSPTAGAGLLLTVINSKASTPDAVASFTTGFNIVGGSWTPEFDQGSAGIYRMQVFSATATGSPGSGTVQASFGAATQTGCIIIIDEVTGQDTSDFVIQPGGEGEASGTTSSRTMSALASSDNAGYQVTAINNNEAQAPNGSEHELADVGHGSPNRHAQSSWLENSNVMTCSWTNTASQIVIFTCEVVAAGAASPDTVDVGLVTMPLTTFSVIPATNAVDVGLVSMTMEAFSVAPSVSSQWTNLSRLTSSTDATSYIATLDRAIQANAGVLVTVINSKGSTPDTPTSVTGGGITWTQVGTSRVNSNMRMTMYQGTSATPSGTSITVSFGAATQTGCIVIVDEINGVDFAGTWIAQSNGTAVTSGATSSLVTLPAPLGDSSHFVYGVVAHAANEAHTQGSGFTELVDVGHGSPNRGAMSMYSTNDTTLDASWASASGYVAMGVEIVPFATSQTVSVGLVSMTMSAFAVTATDAAVAIPVGLATMALEALPVAPISAGGTARPAGGGLILLFGTNFAATEITVGLVTMTVSVFSVGVITTGDPPGPAANINVGLVTMTVAAFGVSPLAITPISPVLTTGGPGETNTLVPLIC